MVLIERHMGFVMLLLAADGAARWAVGFADERAIGFLPLELAVRVVDGVCKILGIKREII